MSEVSSFEELNARKGDKIRFKARKVHADGTEHIEIRTVIFDRLEGNDVYYSSAHNHLPLSTKTMVGGWVTTWKMLERGFLEPPMGSRLPFNGGQVGTFYRTVRGWLFVDRNGNAATFHHDWEYIKTNQYIVWDEMETPTD